MTTMTKTYEVRAVEAEVVTALLDRDDAGRAPRLVVHDEGGSPLRCCLQLSRPGEQVAFVSYAPLRRWAMERGIDPGPYDEVGPIFIHAFGCGGYDSSDFPAALRGSRRMLRAYRADGMIAGGRLVEVDAQPESELEALFADPDVAVVHARAIEFGCFTFEVRRTAT
jgi:hypothetical protein